MRSERHEERWRRNMEALHEWNRTHGTPMAPSGATINLEDGTQVNIGSFVAYVRQRYRIGRLDKSRIFELEGIAGWTWKPLRPGPAGEVDRNEQIRQLRRGGATLTELAEKFGMSRQRIHQIAPDRPDPNMHRARLAHRRANIRAQRKAERDASANRYRS